MIIKPQHSSFSGYTLAEALIALVILNLSIGGVFAGMSKINEYAVVNRFYTSATALVQARIDRSLVDKPFDPIEEHVHPDLVTQTVVTPNIPIYTDPDTNKTLISGTMTTKVESTTLPITTGTAYGNVSLQKTTVTVAYQFKSKNYNVQMTCLRSPDKAQ